MRCRGLDTYCSARVRAVKAAPAHDDAKVVTLASPLDRQRDQDGGRTAASVPARAARVGVPQRCPELVHMTLPRLRSYRRSLLDEELRTSYWRRLLQARRDLLRAATLPGDRAALREALTERRAGNARQLILTLHPHAALPILPQLPDLWASSVDSSDEDRRAELYARLAAAESVLSSYREALHRRLDRATTELVARYHEDPTACLSALPACA